MKTNTNEKMRGRWILALYFCGFGGLSLGVTGLFLSGLAYFEFTGDAPQINQIGTWMMVAAFPVVIFGAHAMDKIGELDRLEKRKAFESENDHKKYIPLQWK